MAELTIDYDNLQGIIDSANTLAVKAESYYESLQNDVINSFGGVTAGVNDVLESAQYYVKAKKQQLADKANEYATFAKNVGVLMAHAIQADLDVATKIENNQEDFLKNHSEIKAAEGIEAFLLNLFVEVKNANPLFEIVADIYVYAFDKLTDAWEQLVYDYRCGGLKEWCEDMASKILVGIAVVVLVCTIVAVIASLPLTAAGAIAWGALTAWDVITAAAAVGSAAFGVWNAKVNSDESHKALECAKNGDPAWAKIHGDINTKSDQLRYINYGDAEKNRKSYLLADGIEITERVCDVINIVDTLGKFSVSVADRSFFDKSITNLRRLDKWMKSPDKVDATIDVIKYNFKQSNSYKLFSPSTPLKDRANSVKGIATGMKNLVNDCRTVDDILYGCGSTLELIKDIGKRKIDNASTGTKIASKTSKLKKDIISNFKDLYVSKVFNYYH